VITVVVAGGIVIVVWVVVVGVTVVVADVVTNSATEKLAIVDQSPSVGVRALTLQKYVRPRSRLTVAGRSIPAPLAVAAYRGAVKDVPVSNWKE